MGAWALAFAAAAQDGGRAYALTASLDGTLSNTETRRPGGASGSSNDGLALQLRPGLQLANRSGRLRGSLAYYLDLIYRPNQSDKSEARNSLNAAYQLEAVEGRLFVDAGANVSQRVLSPFGRQTAVDSPQANDNRTEVGSVSVAPSLRGRLGDVATYDARLSASATNTRHSVVGDSDTTGGGLTINSARGGSLFGWGLLGSYQRAHFRAGRTTESDAFSGSVNYTPNPDIVVTLRGGVETNDIATFQRKSYTTRGISAIWRPTVRTVASVDADHRYFGQSYRVVLEHRLPQSSFRFTSTRDSSTSSDPRGVGQPQTLFQLFYLQFASLEPDPVLRAQFVLDYLRAFGLDPNATVPGGYVTSAVTLQRRDDLSWTYSAKRVSTTLQAFRSSSETLDAASGRGVGRVRQSGFNATVNYRLTPTANIGLVGSRLVTPGTATPRPAPG